MSKRALPQSCGSAALSALAALAAATTLATSVSAHPHVFVTVETTVLYERGAIAGFRHRWTFDEMYTAMALQGLDTNNDGVFDKAELAELAQVNMDGLKDFDFFTFASLAGAPLKLAPPRDAALEHDKDKGLTLDFVLPLAQPVLAEAEGFKFQVADPSIFIAFELAKTDPVRIGAGAPLGCKAGIAAPAPDDAAQRLGQSFSAELGPGSGAIMSQTITVTCPR